MSLVVELFVCFVVSVVVAQVQKKVGIMFVKYSDIVAFLLELPSYQKETMNDAHSFIIDQAPMTKKKSTIELLTLERCPVASGKELDFTFQLKDDLLGGQYFTAQGKLDKEINEEYSYDTKVEIHNGFQYVNYMQANGNLCESVSKIAEKAFAKLKGALEPPVTTSCSFPAGAYKLPKFTIKEDEFQSPIPTSGQFRAKNYLLDADDTEIVCLMFEIKITRENDYDEDSEE